MTHYKLFILLLLFCLSCQRSKTAKDEKTVIGYTDTVQVYPTINYLKLNLKNGTLPSKPYIIRFSHGQKQIVFCGTTHLNSDDFNHPMYAKIEAEFHAFKPDVCVNEGGDVSKKVYASKKEAILKDAEIGLTKILADSLKIPCINGDMTEAHEFRNLLKKYTLEEFIAIIVNDRFMWGLKDQNINDLKIAEVEYKQFIEGYIMKLGKVALNEEQQKFSFFTSSFEKIQKRPFDIKRPVPTNPFENKTKFQEINRTSMQIRDQNLLATVDKLLDKHDKIFIVFGGWHLLACQPGLEQIVKRER
jgi:hypothetical protein